METGKAILAAIAFEQVLAGEYCNKSSSQFHFSSSLSLPFAPRSARFDPVVVLLHGATFRASPLVCACPIPFLHHVSDAVCLQSLLTQRLVESFCGYFCECWRACLVGLDFVASSQILSVSCGPDRQVASPTSTFKFISGGVQAYYAGVRARF